MNKLKDKYYETLLFLISKGECITSLVGQDAVSVDKEILASLHREGLITVSFQDGYSGIVYFKSLSVSLAGYDFISQYEKDNAHWLKRTFRWEYVDKGMKLTRYFGWLLVPIIAFISGKFLG